MDQPVDPTPKEEEAEDKMEEVMEADTSAEHPSDKRLYRLATISQIFGWLYLVNVIISYLVSVIGDQSRIQALQSLSQFELTQQISLLMSFVSPLISSAFVVIILFAIPELLFLLMEIRDNQYEMEEAE